MFWAEEYNFCSVPVAAQHVIRVALCMDLHVTSVMDDVNIEIQREQAANYSYIRLIGF
jgi:hypothetical protein